MAELPISNVINVNLAGLPSGFTERNLNTIGLFTTETAPFVDEYREYISAQQVAQDWGTSATVTQMANAMFAQAPNLRSGNGKLIIMPFEGTSATGENFDTADISANLDNFKLVTDGDIRIGINGTNYDLTGLNFASASTLADVATILQRKIQNAQITESGGIIAFANKKVGSTTVLSVEALPGGTGTDLAGSSYLNVVAGTTTAGTDSAGAETLIDAIVRMESQVFFGVVTTNQDIEDAVITTTATAIQSRDKMFVHHCSAPQDLEDTGIVKATSDASQDQTRLVTYTLTGQADANLYKSAYIGRGFSMNTTGSNTAITMNLKELSGIVPDTNLTQTDLTRAKENGSDVYVSYEGVPSVVSTGGNDYFDNVYFKLAYKFALEAKGFNYLRQTNTKIPQTESGMNGLKDAVDQIAERFVTNGFVGVGLAWNSADTFGDPEVFKNNITNKGYYTYSLPIAQQEQSQREQRIAPVVQHAVKLAGAIHEVTINVTVEA
jgi:hypothetical protein